LLRIALVGITWYQPEYSCRGPGLAPIAASIQPQLRSPILSATPWTAIWPVSPVG